MFDDKKCCWVFNYGGQDPTDHSVSKQNTGMYWESSSQLEESMEDWSNGFLLKAVLSRLVCNVLRGKWMLCAWVWLSFY